MQGRIDENLCRDAYNAWSEVKDSAGHKYHTPVDAWACPACSVFCQSVHVDGDAKLFTYQATWNLDQKEPGLRSSMLADGPVVAHRNYCDSLNSSGGKREPKTVRAAQRRLLSLLGVWLEFPVFLTPVGTACRTTHVGRRRKGQFNGRRANKAQG